MVKQTLQLGTRSVVDIATNSDWKLDKIWEKTDTLPERTGKQLKYIFEQNAHPVVKGIKEFTKDPDDEQKWEKLKQKSIIEQK